MKKTQKTNIKNKSQQTEKVTWAISFKQFIKFIKDEQCKNTDLLRLTY